jgi:hypothetical protein
MSIGVKLLIIARPLDIRKYLYFAKKRDLYRLKIALLSLVVYTHQVYASYSYHRWTNKKPCRKKLLPLYVMMCTSAL